MPMRKTILTVALATCGFCMAAAADYLPMIVKDRVWEYQGDYFIPGESGRIRHFMKFDGETTVNGKTYTGFVLYRADLYENGDESMRRTEERTGPRYFLREEPGRVYVLTDGDLMVTSYDESDWLDPAVDDASYCEFLLYDFTLGEGETCALPMGSDTGSMATIPCLIHWMPEREINGTGHRVIQYELAFDEEGSGSMSANEDVIEQIGVTANGHLASFLPLLTTSIFNNSYEEPGQHTELVSVCDSDGTVLYGTPSSVENIAVDTVADANEDIIYDVMGRRVRSTVPGSVYIRGGKKFVAR